MVERRDLQLPTLDEARAILGGRLPSIIESTQFNEHGLAVTPEGLKVPVYLASGLGFNLPGRYYIEHELKPRMKDLGALVLDPFEQCGEFIDPSEMFNTAQPVEEYLAKLKHFNEVIVGTVNYKLLIPRSKIMFAVMEGSPVDEGAAAEVAYMATNFGPVVAVRTDIRRAENAATGTNPAVTYFASDDFSGKYYEGPNAYEEGYLLLGSMIQSYLKG